MYVITSKPIAYVSHVVVNCRFRLKEQGAAQLLLYVNPPRTGLEPEVRQWITAIARPRRMAYLSCSNGTPGRDLAQLCGAGYPVECIQPYDFSP